MIDYEEEYQKIVKSPPSREYKSAEEEAWNIPKYTLLKNEEIHYGDIVYYQDTDSHKNDF